jgi:ABC-type Zn2+ transport system substrate-binding protein/surface adhesin
LTLTLHTRILRSGELRGWFAEHKLCSQHQTPRQNLRKAINLTPTDTPTGSSLDVQDDTLTPSATASSLQDHDGESHDLEAHDHEGHNHEGHEHHHQPAPTLNPDLTRSIEVEASAEDVSKAFQQVTKRYTKLARIPGFRAGKVPVRKFARKCLSPW